MLARWAANPSTAARPHESTRISIMLLILDVTAFTYRPPGVGAFTGQVAGQDSGTSLSASHLSLCDRHSEISIGHQSDSRLLSRRLQTRTRSLDETDIGESYR